MRNNHAAANTTYGSDSLADKLLASLEQIGMDTTALTTADFITFDELHIMGRQATIDLGRRAGLDEKMRVLDLGSGVGGPARTLAETFGCQVIGLDLAEVFVEASRVLSARVGLSDSVSFHQGDVLDMPFDDETFDAVFMIHLNMNVEDKTAMFSEIRRVMKKGAKLVLWEVCKGDKDGFIFPVPWADDDSFSTLVEMDDLINHLKEVGLHPLVTDDATQEAADWVRARLEAAKKKNRPSRPQPDLDLVLKDFRLKRANVSKNLLGGAIRVLRAIAVK